MDELNGNDKVAGVAEQTPDRRKNGRRSTPIPRLLRPAEVAEILQVHRSSVYRLHRRGLLPAVTIPPDTVRFRVEDLERFINRCRKRRVAA